jgi:hypothetical protein
MSTFGSFHIVRLFVDEYIFFVVEQRIANVQSLSAGSMSVPSLSGNNVHNTDILLSGINVNLPSFGIDGNAMDLVDNDQAEEEETNDGK